MAVENGGADVAVAIVSTCKCICVHAYVCMHMCAFTYMCVIMCACARIKWVYARMCICACAYVRARI